MSAFLEDLGRALAAGEVPTESVVGPLVARSRLALAFPDPVTVVHLTPQFVESRYVVGLFVDDDARIQAIAKVPRRDWDVKDLHREAEMLELVRTRVPRLVDRVPQVLALVEVDGRTVLFISAVRGDALTHSRVRRDPEAADAVLELLGRLPTTGSWSGQEMLSVLLEESIEQLRLVLPAGHPLHELVDATLDIVAPLRGMRLPRIFEHGDPSHPNLLVEGTGREARIGLLDWELARVDGAPGHDAAQFLAFRSFSRAGAHGVTSEVRVFRSDYGTADSPDRLAFGASLPTEVPPEADRPLFVLSWARSALRILHRLGTGGDADGTGPGREVLLAELEVHRNTALWREAVLSAS